uniref:Elongation of very long chain fatty acids protein n=1 Tax=Anopheles quadriannulatus TaxID=34691 RepID=A0A182WWA5_ANOQN
MALVLRNIYQTFNYFFTEYKDPRIENYPLLGSPWPIVMIIILYLKFVNDWGRRLMKYQTPYDLTIVMNIYNLIQIFLNLYIGIVGGLNSYFDPDYSWSCETINQKDNPVRRKLIFITYLYFISKIIDLLDTVFFILRKKYNQITFLHTYHHAGMYGPRHMLNRKPYNVLNMIKIYNLIQMIANITLFLHICYNVFLLYDNFSFRCQPIDYSISRVGMDEVYFSYAYFLLKLLDLADT